MSENLKILKLFAILNMVLGGLNLLFVFFSVGNSLLVNVITGVLKMLFGYLLLQTCNDSSKVSLALYIAVIILQADAVTAVLNFLRDVSLFGLIVDLLALAIDFYLVSILNKIKKGT